MSSSTLLSASGRPLAAEEKIECAGVGGQIAPEQAAWLEPGAPGPFESEFLHPLRRAGPAARQKVEKAARCLDNANIGQQRRVLLHECLLVGHAERDPEI